MSELDLGSNFLTGNVPSFANSSLSQLNIGSNIFSGALSVDFLKDSVNLQVVDLSDNLLTGNVPANVPLGSVILDFSSNAFTGAIPRWNTSGLVRQLDLHSNLLYANQVLTIDLPNFMNVNLSNQVFWQGSAADRGSIRLFSFNGSVGTLDTRHAVQQLRCPYPPHDSNIVWLRDGCDTDLTLVWVLFGVSGICVTMGVALARRVPSGSQTSDNKLRICFQKVVAVGGWLFVVFDIFTDVASCRQMLDFVAAYSVSSEVCESFDNTFLPSTHYLDVMDTFSQYLSDLSSALSDEVLLYGLPQLEADDILASVELRFLEVCNSAPGCVYDSNAASCVQDPSYQSFPMFKTSVNVMLITILSKEVFKVGMVLWCAIRGLSSPWLRPLCYGSAGLPLLLMRPTVLWEVLSFEPSRGEEGVEFILECCLENMPQFILGVYLTYVTAVGISDLQVLSLFLGGLALMKQGWSLLVWLGCIKSKGASMTVADSTGPWSRQRDEASVGVELPPLPQAATGI